MNKNQIKKSNNSSKSDNKISKNKNKKENDIQEKNPKLGPINCNIIGESVKIKVSNKFLEMEKNEERLLQFQKIIQEQESTIKILKQGVEPYNIEIQNLKQKISEIQNENEILRKKDIKTDLEMNNLKIKVDEEQKIKNELIESNKKLQQKIEILNKQIDDFKYENKRDQEEYINMCKVKDNFEDKIIKLNDELEKTKVKLQTCENVIKQKEKYIQMLVNKKNNSTYYNIRNKEQEKQSEQSSNINSRRYVRPQSFGIKNRNVLNKQSGKNYDIGSNQSSNAIIIEQENIIKKLKEKIVFLERDNAGLLIRLKNNNNLKYIKK